MFWNQLTVDVPEDLKDAIVGELHGDGVAGFWESAETATGLTRLVLYLSQTADLRSVERRIETIFDRNCRTSPIVLHSRIEERDWTEEWKKGHSSFPVGKTFFVIPSWAKTACPPDRIPVRIDPGQAFGTGAHESTQLAIEALERWIGPDDVVLDLGTGSGILAITSRLLGAWRALACDIDPVAVRVARENIKRNAQDHIWTFCGSVDAVATESVKLVLCNLTADLILRTLQDVDRVLEPHGIAIFAGILQEQNEQVREKIDLYRFTVHEERLRGEWVALIAEKHVS